MLSDDPKMFDKNDSRTKQIVKEIEEQILARVNEIDKQEYGGTEKDIGELIKKWDTARTQFSSWASNGKGDLKYRRNPFTNKIESDTTYLLNSSRDVYDERIFVIPESLREAESEISLYYYKNIEADNNG